MVGPEEQQASEERTLPPNVPGSVIAENVHNLQINQAVERPGQDFGEQTLDLNITHTSAPTRSGVLAPSPVEFCTLFLGLQEAYEQICDYLGIALHDLEVVQIDHPNISISLKGLGEPITALKDLIESMPEIVVGLWTIPDRVREKKAEIKANTEYHGVLKEVFTQYRNVPINDRTQYLNRVLQYRMASKPPPDTPWVLTTTDLVHKRAVQAGTSAGYSRPT